MKTFSSEHVEFKELLRLKNQTLQKYLTISTFQRKIEFYSWTIKFFHKKTKRELLRFVFSLKILYLSLQKSQTLANDDLHQET